MAESEESKRQGYRIADQLIATGNSMINEMNHDRHDAARELFYELADYILRCAVSRVVKFAIPEDDAPPEELN